MFLLLDSEDSSCLGVYIWAFQGEQNPLPSQSVVETCVMPVLLLDSESWYLTDTALDKLEQFQSSVLTIPIQVY